MSVEPIDSSWKLINESAFSSLFLESFRKNLTSVLCATTTMITTKKVYFSFHCQSNRTSFFSLREKKRFPVSSISSLIIQTKEQLMSWKSIFRQHTRRRLIFFFFFFFIHCYSSRESKSARSMMWNNSIFSFTNCDDQFDTFLRQSITIFQQRNSIVWSIEI